jgi:NAD(P)-dependent dehydrogenase (short-subunit alcohol dehydrogenase family)
MTRLDRINLNGRVVAVTGAARGLGLAYAHNLAARGATVLVNDLDAANCELAAEEVRARGGRAVGMPGSVTNGQDVDRIIAAAIADFGRLDGLVCNAGNVVDKPFLEHSVEDWQSLVDVHLIGTFRLVKAAWPIMTAQGYGRIVLIASAAGYYGTMNEVAYSAVKAGIPGFLAALVRECPDGVRVNAVAPVAATATTTGFWDEATTAMCSPERVAPAVTYLCSENAPQGVVLAALGGTFSTFSACESDGLAISGPEIEPEDIRDRFAEIDAGGTRYRYYRSGQHVERMLAITPYSQKADAQS